MTDDVPDWDRVHRTNFESTAFWDVHWVSNARDLYESAKRLESDIEKVWESYRARSRGEAGSLVPDHFQAPYFMLLAFATENLLKAAAVARNSISYKAEFRKTLKFPSELKSHDLVQLAQFVELPFTKEEEDLLRRLTRSAIWFGRYPAPLGYKEMSGSQQFIDGNERSLSWFGGNDVARLNAFILGLPDRLGLHVSDWPRPSNSSTSGRSGARRST